MTLVGAGILWLGWNGFNGGDPYFANADAGAAVLNTNTCTAVALLVWTVLDKIAYGKPSVLGAVNGMIAGLVAITPAAGYVDGMVLLVRIQDGAEILARKPGAGPVTALGWSADGRFLAFGTEGGEAGVLDLK